MKNKSNLIKPVQKHKANYGQFSQEKVFNNFDVSFQLYEERYQEIKIKDLKREQLKEFDKLILEILKCKNEAELGRINRGKTNPVSGCKIGNHRFKDEMIHLGKDKSKFRLHGILYGMSFKIICIDPDHKIHKI